MLAAICLPNCSVDNNNDRKPNIIYVLADDLGYGDISAFNEKGKILTPNIDRLAAEGIKFTDAHTSSAVCSPTRYGILTGRYSWRSRMKQGVLSGNSKALIPNSRLTVASLLKSHHYNTAFMGKWHLGWDWSAKDRSARAESPATIDFNNIDYAGSVENNPNDLGFDYAFGHAASLDMSPYVYVENGKVTALPDTTTVNTGKYSWWREGPTGSDFVHENVTPGLFERAITHIEQHAGDNNPFFLYLALPSPHTPILPTTEWQDKSGLNPYADFVMMIDDYMGKLLKAVDDAGIKDNTLIIFTSDNGCAPYAGTDELESLGHHPSYIYRGYKADIFEGGHRVPFIARWPGNIPPAITSAETICSTDLLATCAEIIGYDLKDNEGEDSYSLLPLFLQQNLDHPLREATVHHSVNGSFAIRKGDWKLIMCPGSGGWSFPTPSDTTVMDALPAIQLYNLASDPEETKNLAVTESARVTELEVLLTSYIRNGRSTPGATQQNDEFQGTWHQISFVE
jgi:arylsulfatase A-like enzyme